MITKTGLLHAVVVTVILLWGFSQQYTAPQSFLGTLTTDTIGMIAFASVITVVGFGVTLVLNILGYPISRTIFKDDD